MITDDERERAWELSYLIKDTLEEHERQKLYVAVYTRVLETTGSGDAAARIAKSAIDAMGAAFAPVCEHCQEQANVIAQAKAN